MRLTATGLVVGRGTEVLAGPLRFALGSGEALIVTGPNGIGKSTFLRTLAGLLPAAGGAITIAGIKASDGEPARHLREAAHYLGSRNAMKGADTVRANLMFWRRFLGSPALGIDAALEAVGLAHAADSPFALLSSGQQRRAAIARLLVAERAVWLLDEPTVALDREGQDVFARIAGEHLAAGGILVAATHQPLGIANAATLRLERPPATERAELGAAAETWL